MKLVVILVLGLILLVPRDEEVPQGGEGVGEAVVGIAHLLEQQAPIAGQLRLWRRHLFIGEGLQLIECRLGQGARLQQHQAMGRQVLLGVSQGPHLLLLALERLEGPGQGGGKDLPLDGLPGAVPLLLEALGLGRILAEDEVGPQGGDGGDQRLLARLIPLQGGQGLLQQGRLRLLDPAQLVVHQGGGEDDEQIDKTKAKQQLA
ncbi:hypothetical protein D3C79_626080 [compost metagenome]